MEQEHLLDARGLIRELVAFLAREKRMPADPPREPRIEARLKLFAEQAVQLGVDYDSQLQEDPDG